MVILPSIRRKYMTRRDPGGKIPLGDAVITLDKDVWQYTGSAITPTPVVTLYGNLLTVNVDFTVGYTGNVEVGQGVVTITGMGQYSGQRQKSFVIEAAPAPSGWDFDIHDARVVKMSDWSEISSLIKCVSFSGNENDAVAITGSGFYLRHLKISNYDPDTVDEILISQEGKEYSFISTPDGIHFYACNQHTGGGVKSFYQFVVDEAFDLDSIPNRSHAQMITTMSELNNRYSVFVFVSGDGMKAVAAGYYGTTIIVCGYSLSVPFDLMSAAIIGDKLSASSSLFIRISMSPDGLCFVGLKSDDRGLNLCKYELSVPYDFSTAEYKGEILLDDIKANAGYSSVCVDSLGNNAMLTVGTKTVCMLKLRPQS